MRKLLNTLYIFSEDAYLALDGENVVAKRGGDEIGRIPLHTLEAIQAFSYAGASPALMGACVSRGISMAFYDRRGRFLADVHGTERGTVLLRKAQFRCAEDPSASVLVARQFIIGKLFNSRWVLERLIRDHGPRIDVEAVRAASLRMGESMKTARTCDSLDSLRGIEGDAAAVYFSVFDQLLLRDKDTFSFSQRVRRPPTDPVNAMLSLFYSVLARDCSSALEGVGLDPYVGFLHADRPGRRSLALDLMEELRALMVDRLVVSAVNNRVVNMRSFEWRESGEVILSDAGRKAMFELWQNKKRESIAHPFLKEKVPWGLLPYVQAQLLAKCLRGDLDGYPPLLWK